MDALLSGFSGLFLVAATGSATLAMTIILSGVLSGLVVFGVLELMFRESLQSRAIREHFPRYGRQDDFARFIEEKYETIFRSSGKKLPVPREYLRWIEHGDFLEIASNGDPEHFFRLNYRQICGQMQSVIVSEAEHLSAGQVTPMTDLLNFTGYTRKDRRTEWAPIFRREPSRFEEGVPEIERVRVAARSYFEDASREIDKIQVLLATKLNDATFPFVFWIWFAIYALLIDGWFVTRAWFGFAGPLDYLLAVVWYPLGLLLCTGVGAGVALGSAVVGAIAFTWFDRFLASK
jgi:hypothetical protein